MWRKLPPQQLQGEEATLDRASQQCHARTVGCIVDPFAAATAAAGPGPDKLIAAIAIGKLPKGVASCGTDRTDRRDSYSSRQLNKIYIHIQHRYERYLHDINQNCQSRCDQHDLGIDLIVSADKSTDCQPNQYARYDPDHKDGGHGANYLGPVPAKRHAVKQRGKEKGRDIENLIKMSIENAYEVYPEVFDWQMQLIIVGKTMSNVMRMQ